MALSVPHALVTAPDREPLPYGLFSQLVFRPEGDGRWQAGVTFQPSGCDGLTGTVPTCTTTTLDLAAAEGRGEMVEADPFTVVGLFKCSPVGFSAEDANDEATAFLQRGEEQAVEHMLWHGEAAVVDEHPGHAAVLTGAGVEAIGVAPYKLVDAFARIEWEIAQRQKSRGLIHVDWALASLAVAKGVLEVKGNKLATKLGTPVVAGAGYGPETYPAEHTIVATGAAVGYRTETFTSSDNPGDLLDRTSNDMYGAAYRTYVIGFDNCMTPISATIDPAL